MLKTRDIAEKIGVHPETIKRWVRQGKVPAPKRDRNGWYLFDEQDLKNITEYANKIHVPEQTEFPQITKHVEEEKQKGHPGPNLGGTGLSF